MIKGKKHSTEYWGLLLCICYFEVGTKEAKYERHTLTPSLTPALPITPSS